MICPFCQIDSIQRPEHPDGEAICSQCGRTFRDSHTDIWYGDFRRVFVVKADDDR